MPLCSKLRRADDVGVDLFETWKTLSLVLFACVGLGAHSLAQSQEGEEPVRRVFFRTFGLNIAVEGLHYESRPGEIEGVSVSSGVRSPFFRYIGPGRMVFFRTETRSDGTLQRIPAAYADIAEELEQPLVFFIENPEQPNRYQTVVVEDDPDQFRAGEMRIFNLGGESLAMRLADKTLVIPGGSHRKVDIKATESGNVEVLAAKRDGQGAGDWRLIYSTTWGLAEGDRTVVFLSPHGRSISVKRFPENVPFIRNMHRRFQNQLESGGQDARDR